MVYLANTAQKFSHTNANEVTDGVATYPTASEGTVTVTNGGAQSILISGAINDTGNSKSYKITGVT